jgi:pimeloyl-ACP methyl ester carboxylesterase
MRSFKFRPGKVSRLEIPVYFFSGRYDLTVNKDLSKAYLNNLEAPIKGFYTFHNSAHSPMFEEPVRFVDILIKDVLNQTTVLADD